MGRLFIEVLPEEEGKFACKKCLTDKTASHLATIVHLASAEDLLSRSFHSRYGPAYLFTTAINVTLGEVQEREMTTGSHLIRDLFCVSCGNTLGWRYECAYETKEKYKEGKYILERMQMVDIDAERPPSTASFSGPPNSSPLGLSYSQPGSIPPGGLNRRPPPLLSRHVYAGGAHRSIASGASGGGGRPLFNGLDAELENPLLPDFRTFLAAWAPVAPLVVSAPPFNVDI